MSMPIVVQELRSSQTIRADPISVLRPNSDWIPSFKELKSLMSKAEQPSYSSSSAVKLMKPFKDWKSKGTHVSTILPIKLHIATSPNLLPVVLTLTWRRRQREALTWMPC